MNPELAMAAMDQENDANDEQVFQDVLMKTAIAHRLKRQSSSRDLSFTIIELTNIIQALIDNRREIIEFAVLFDHSHPSHTNPFAPAWSKHYLPSLARDRLIRRLWQILLQRFTFCGKTLHAVLMWHQLYLTRGLNLGVRCRSLPWPLYECTLSARQSWRQRGTQEKL